MRSKINIVILTPGFTPGETDTSTVPGLQLYLKELRRQLPEAGLRVVAFRFPHPNRSYLWNGIPVWAAGGKRNKIARVLTWIRVLRHLYNLRNRTGIDVIHAFWLSESALVGLIFGWLAGIPVVTTAMGQDVKPGNRYLPLVSLFRPETILLSEYQRAFLERWKKIRITGIIPFGVDARYYRDLPVERNTDILGAGSLNRVKNYPEFLEVVTAAVREFPGVRCRIIGEGEESEPVRHLILEKRLGANVVLAGGLDYESTQKEMCAAKILLHTSGFEGQGMVLTEALSAGAYVVCHPVGIALTLHSSRLLTAGTTDGLASHVCSVLRMEARDHSSQISQRIEDTCRKYLILYRSLHENLKE